MSEGKKIELDIQCKECKGTGVYIGMGERDGAAVVCHRCDGTGKYHYAFEYKDFGGRIKRRGVKRVYKSGYGYCLAPKKIKFQRVGEIDLAQEGVSYDEFWEGKHPQHIRKMACPMLADQGACHEMKGFTATCGCCAGRLITECPQYADRARCWERFDKAAGEEV